MTNVFELPQEDRRLDEASVWIARLDKGLSPEQQSELRAWSAYPANRDSLLELAELWDKMDVVAQLASLLPSSDRPGHARRRLAPAMAACALAFSLAGLWAAFGHSPAGPPTEAVNGVYRTAVGELSTIRLVDGTQINLNTDSLIRVHYTDAHRLVTLERGEVLVKVAEDAARPLSVLAGGNIVQAVGTEFNIRITDDQEVELVVTEGRVRVGIHPQRAASTEPVALPPSSLTVSAGKELILGSSYEEVTEISAEDIEVKLSWRNGNLIFRGESLEDAVNEIGRYTSVEFVFLDDDLRKVRIVGLFKAGDVDGLLEALRANFDIAYQRVDDRTVLLDRNTTAKPP